MSSSCHLCDAILVSRCFWCLTRSNTCFFAILHLPPIFLNFANSIDDFSSATASSVFVSSFLSRSSLSLFMCEASTFCCSSHYTLLLSTSLSPPHHSLLHITLSSTSPSPPSLHFHLLWSVYIYMYIYIYIYG